MVSDCAVPECVNPVYEPEQCCPICKNGKHTHFLCESVGASFRVITFFYQTTDRKFVDLRSVSLKDGDAINVLGIKMIAFDPFDTNEQY